MRVRDVMTKVVQTIRRDEDLEVARQLMLWCGFRHLPVVEQGEIVGILSERDVLARKAATREADHPGRRDTIADAMRAPVETAHPDDDAFGLASRMSARRIGCVPVVEDRALVGIVTTTDLLAAFGTQPAARVLGGDVSSVMTPEPLRLRPNDTVGNAVALMLTENVRHLPVVDEDRRVVGIVSDRDIRALVGEPLTLRSPPNRRALLQTLVAGIMTTGPVTVRESSPLDDAIDLLVERKIGALPVVDGDDRLVGMLSYVDVLQSTRELSA